MKEFEVDRRTFVCGALKITAALVVPSVLTARSYPLLVGDGLHDDTDALQALLDGDVAQLSDGTLIGGTKTVDLWTGHYRITRSLICGRSNTMIDGHGSLIDGSDIARDQYYLVLTPTKCYEPKPIVFT